MTKFLGRLVSFGIAREATRGTGQAAADVYIPHTQLDVDVTPDKILDESSAGSIVKSIDDAVDTKKATVTIESKAGEDSLGHFLLGMFGSVASAVNPDTTTTHTFTLLNSSLHPSFTLFVNDPVQGYRFANGVLSNMKLSAQLGQYLLVQADFMSKSQEENAQSPAYTSEANFLPQHLSVRFADDVAGLDAAPGICVRSIEISSEKGVMTDKCLGSQEYSDILNGVVEFKGTMNIAYDKKDFRDNMLNDVAKTFRLKAVNAGKVIGTGTQNPEFELDFHNVKFDAGNPNYETADIASQQVDFTAHLNLTTGEVGTAKLINTMADYDAAA